jgi:hypothetical protein
MNDLSDQSQTDVPQAANPPMSEPVVSSGSKEVVSGGPDRPEGLRDATGQETELPKEVSSAGVKLHPTTVPIPKKVSRMGVAPAGQNVPVQTTTTVVLPISDDQIAAGLGQGITSSWRWLSEWCLRRFRQLHIVVKMVHGKLIRMNG